MPHITLMKSIDVLEGDSVAKPDFDVQTEAVVEGESVQSLILMSKQKLW